MDKIKKYRGAINKIFGKYLNIVPANLPNVENELIIDEKRNHYQLIRVGFENNRRVHYCVFHVDIINDKIWVQHDATDIPLVQLFLDEGITREEIVLGFHAPYRRELSDFAVA